ncbi:MAG: PcfB family protein [Clostridiales bacterium]|nr:PcfB family protein [Clostridiales bacterium]
MTKETDTIEEYKALEVVNIRLVKEPSIISEKPISNANDAVNLIQNLIKDFDREALCTLNLAADGVLYSILREKGNDDPNASIDIIARTNDAPKITRIVERFNLSKVDKASVVRDMESERNPISAKAEKELQSLHSLKEVEGIRTDKQKKPSVKAELNKLREEMKKEQKAALPRRAYLSKGTVRRAPQKPKAVKER